MKDIGFKLNGEEDSPKKGEIAETQVNYIWIEPTSENSQSAKYSIERKVKDFVGTNTPLSEFVAISYYDDI